MADNEYTINILSKLECIAFATHDSPLDIVFHPVQATCCVARRLRLAKLNLQHKFFNFE